MLDNGERRFAYRQSFVGAVHAGIVLPKHLHCMQACLCLALAQPFLGGDNHEQRSQAPTTAAATTTATARPRRCSGSLRGDTQHVAATTPTGPFSQVAFFEVFMSSNSKKPTAPAPAPAPRPGPQQKNDGRTLNQESLRESVNIITRNVAAPPSPPAPKR